MAEPRKPDVRLTAIAVAAPAPLDLAQFYAKHLDGGVTAFKHGARPGERDAGWAPG